MATESEKKKDELATAVVDAVTDATASVVAEKGDAKAKDEVKLDEQTEFFARRIIDGVTKNIAEILKPSAPPAEEPESDDTEDDSPKRRKRQAPATKPKKKSLLTSLLGG